MIAAAEGVVILSAVLILPVPQPVTAFLFGAVTRRALGGARGLFPVKALPAVAGYLCGQAISVSVMLRAGSVDPDEVVAGLLPLLGLVVGSIALNETVRAVRFEQDARTALHAVLQASPVGMLLTDDTGISLLHNDRARAMFISRDGTCEVLCQHRQNIVHCGDGCRAAGPIELTVDGDVLEVHTVPVMQKSGPELTLVVAVDVSRRRRQEEVLRIRAEQDDLTGLFSRMHFLQLVDEALSALDGVGLFVIDLDQFKEVNDADGHDVGDTYLRAAARRIRTTVGHAAPAARLGGDEFAVLVPASGAHETARLANRVLSALAAGPDPEIRASIGVAISAPETTTEELVRDADAAMYSAKREGGARVKVFEREMGERVLARQRDKADLRRAVHGGELVVHYQPIVDLSTSSATGAEALVRWQRPGRGLVGPAEFVGLAEETGLIVPLGHTVLAEACAQGVRWHAEGRELGVTVNVSTRQLSSAAFRPSLDLVLDATGLPPDQLTIEVTESVWADEAAMRGLMAVRDGGVRVALDDFGTGYSSLSYLQRYPFDVVKIDRSFTNLLGDDTGRTAGVLRCIIDLAEVLGAHSVAEGVETQEQADWLRQEGCSFAQGYLFGKPDHPDNWDGHPAVRAAHAPSSRARTSESITLMSDNGHPRPFVERRPRR